MAAFDAEEEKQETRDWAVLLNGGISMYWRRDYLNEDLEWFRHQNYQIYSFNCAEWTLGNMHADFQRTLGFPSYYGHNFDALNDCLEHDVSVPDRGGALIALNRFDNFSKGMRPEAEIVLDLLARASRRYLLTGRRFLTLIQSDDPAIYFDRLGGVVPTWNWREWLNKDRGL